MIENEMLDELADFLGLREKIAAITARAMNGELDFAAALNERVALLKGLPVGKLDAAAKRIRYTPGGATLVATMKKHGATCALVSGASVSVISWPSIFWSTAFLMRSATVSVYCEGSKVSVVCASISCLASLSSASFTSVGGISSSFIDFSSPA